MGRSWTDLDVVTTPSGLSGRSKGRLDSFLDPPSRSLRSLKAFCLRLSASLISPGMVMWIEDELPVSANRLTTFLHNPTLTKNSNTELAIIDIGGCSTFGKKLAKLKFSAGSPLDPLLCF